MKAIALRRVGDPYRSATIAVEHAVSRFLGSKAVLPVGAAAVGLFTAYMVHTRGATAIGIPLGAVLLWVAMRHAVVLWAGALFIAFFWYEPSKTTVLIRAGSIPVTVSDGLVILGLVVALATWRPHRAPDLGGATAVLLASGLALVVLSTVPVTLEAGGREGLFVMRHLAPFLIVPFLPSARPFQRLSSHAVATVVSLALVGLAVRSVSLLSAGFVARASVGEQRIFQTWEPFIAAALGLVLLAYVLAAERPRALHLAGLIASLIPVIFAFFRTAWVFEAVLGIILVVVCARPGRRGKLILGLVIVAVAGTILANAFGNGGRSYAQQVQDRFSQITTTLDPYRIDEFAAVNREIHKAPFIGSGFGTHYAATWTPYTANAHNSYQWLWWRVGIVGLALFLATLLLPMALALRRRNAMAPDDRGLAFGLVAGLLFTMLAANLQENFENYQTNVVVALMLAHLIVLVQRPRQAS